MTRDSTSLRTKTSMAAVDRPSSVETRHDDDTTKAPLNSSETGRNSDSGNGMMAIRIGFQCHIQGVQTLHPGSFPLSPPPVRYGIPQPGIASVRVTSRLQSRRFTYVRPGCEANASTRVEPPSPARVLSARSKRVSSPAETAGQRPNACQRRPIIRTNPDTPYSADFGNDRIEPGRGRSEAKVLRATTAIDTPTRGSRPPNRRHYFHACENTSTTVSS